MILTKETYKIIEIKSNYIYKYKARVYAYSYTTIKCEYDFTETVTIGTIRQSRVGDIITSYTLDPNSIISKCSDYAYPVNLC